MSAVHVLSKFVGAVALAASVVAVPSAVASSSAAACVPDVAAQARGGYDGQDHRAISRAEQLRVERQLDRRTNRSSALAARSIPVYVHVIRSTRGEGAVSATQIDRQITELNQDFAGGESAAAANSGFTFTLAGTNTFTNNTWFKGSQQNQMRSQTRQGGASALNVWTLNFSYLGIATFPWNYATNPSLDGIRVLYTTLPGGTATNYDQGKTATHEAGHWLGLYHTFQGGCTAPGDQVADTPFQASPTEGCPTGRDSCTAPGLDPIENYMDYSFDSCYNRFTAGQSTRMNDAYAAYRA